MALEGSGMTLEGVGMNAMSVESGHLRFRSAWSAYSTRKRRGDWPNTILLEVALQFPRFQATVCIKLPYAAQAHPPSSR